MTSAALDVDVFVATPAAPTVGNQGTPGVTAHSYKIVAKGDDGEKSAASAAGSTSTGAGTLNGTNFNRLTWTAVPGATGYDVYRTAGGATQGLIGSTDANTTTLDDTGLAGDGATAPSSNSSGPATATSLTSYKGKKVVQLGGTFVATLKVEGTLDDVNWFPVAPAQSVPGPVPLPKRLSKVRITQTAYTSGTPTATLVAAR